MYFSRYKGLIMITVYGKDFESKEDFGLWLNTAPKNEVLPVLIQARRRAYIVEDYKTYDQVDNIIGQVTRED